MKQQEEEDGSGEYNVDAMHEDWLKVEKEETVVLAQTSYITVVNAKWRHMECLESMGLFMTRANTSAYDGVNDEQ